MAPFETFQTLKSILDTAVPPLHLRKVSADSAEYAGTKPAMQGKQKVDGFYFATIQIKPKDCRLYFFPLYTHRKHFGELSTALQKFLKGKTCFHVKHLDEALTTEIQGMVKLGLKLYQKDGLI